MQTWPQPPIQQALFLYDTPRIIQAKKSPKTGLFFIIDFYKIGI